jgi:hypothetical protein
LHTERCVPWNARPAAPHPVEANQIAERSVPLSQIIRIVLTTLLAGTPIAPLSADDPAATHEAWWVDSLHQVLVDDLAPASPTRSELHAARGEYEVIQVAARSPAASRVAVIAPAFGPGEGLDR